MADDASDDRPTGFEVCAADADDPAPPPNQLEWLTGIAGRLQQPDGHIGAMYCAPSPLPDAAPHGWRFIAYFGDSWERAGDGWRHVELTGDDPISKRDEAAVEEVWRQCIADSRADHEQQKAAAL